MSPKKILRYSALVLFIFSIIQLALALTGIIANDMMSLESLDFLFVTNAQNAALSVVSGFVGGACGYMGLLCARNKASAITYRYITTGLLIVYIVVNAFIFANAAAFPWLGILVIALITIGYLFGLFRMTGKL